MDGLKLDVKKVNKRTARRDRNQEDEFGEYLPNYMNQPRLFEEKVAEGASEDSAKSKILRNVFVLVALLALQIILFYLLIQSSQKLLG